MPTRREVLLGAGASVFAGVFPKTSQADLQSWSGVRDLFELDRSWIHMAGLLLASHPVPVRKLIDEHRRGFDRNPVEYWHNTDGEGPVRAAAAKYLGTQPGNIALTDSTTMSLAILYNGIQLKPDQEFVTTTHDHMATHQSIALRCRKTGHQVRRVPLFASSAKATKEEILGNFQRAFGPKTRVFAVTYVHSATGMKLPIADMSAIVRKVNENRAEDDRVLFCVDGVHGFGNQDFTIDELGCDFLAAGTHKWLFGPRGTGILYGRPAAQRAVIPTIPSFSGGISWGHQMTPGGFHSFEHRFALGAAFELHQQIGKARIAQRITELNRQAKAELSKMKGITLHPPIDPALSGALVCFEVAGMTPGGVIAALEKKRIIASTTPYAVSYARITPGLLNTPDEVDRTCAAIRELV